MDSRGRGSIMTDGKHGRTLGVSSGKSVRLAALLSLQVTISIPTAYAEAPPLPSKTSLVGQTVTNPITGSSTTVSVLRVDPAGTPTAGNTAFVQTADGYTFLVKTAGEVFYNSDAPPVAFVVTSVDGDKAVVTGTQATGSEKFALVQSTVAFNDSFNSSGSEGILTPPVDVSGPNGVKQVVYGQNGSNGRVGALFVPPSSGGNGSGGPTNTQTLSGNVNATSNIGWEIGSVGGSGGKGGNSYASFWSGRDGGDGGLGGNVIATQATSSIIKTTDDANHGIFTYSRSGEAGDGGGGFAAPGGGTGGHSSSGGDVTVNQYGVIATDGQNAHGIYALSVSNNGGNGGDQWGLVGKAGSGGYGGNGGQVNVNTYAGAQIITEQDYSNGIFAQSIGGSGSSAGTSGNLLVSLIGQADNGGDGSTVTVSNGGEIQTKGVASRGIMAQSIGGGGGAGGTATGLVALAMGGVGSNGGSGGAVSVTNTGTGTIHTLGDLADGIMAQSIGGSGGQGANAYGLVSIGGSGSKGGSGSTVSVTNYGRIDTEGNGARGIIAQSIGGGGGDGGSSGGMVAVGGSGAGGGAGLTVNVTNDGIITTKGDDAKGILAQSIGGGGGNGCSSGSVGAFASVGIGGKGGAGGVGGNVDVTLSNTDVSKPLLIATSGDRSTGVFVQSIGGGGGNGGGAVSVAVGAVGAVSVSVGGEGGRGGAGGTTMLTGSGDAAVQTEGADAAGILLQSVGGGGGNGGYAISAAASAGPIAGALAVGIGGSGGLGGAGGEVRVGALDGSGNLLTPGFSGSVVTTGERSAGMIFQSVGGGGGNGGLAVAATGSGSKIFSGSISVGVGGSGGNGGNGGLVSVYTDADITTRGNSSSALLAQSIGGGGGNGGGSIAAGVAGSGGGSGTISVGVGGSGAGGGVGDTVNLIAGGDIIRTTGQFSTAIIAQSVGGGGGNGGYTIAAGAAGAGVGAGAVNVGVGGSAAGGGSGGAVNAQVDATVVTEKDDSGAILIQSIGGGGGNGGFSIAAGAAGAGAGAGSVSVGLGGSAGAGGAGGTVDAHINKDVGTQGHRAAGVVAQSIGGGGGNGGFSVSGSVSGAGAGSGSVSVGLGGSGGDGGDGSTVAATVEGNVTTEGTDSTAILAQSVGGGGGNGGFNISGAISGSGVGSGAVSVGLGGGGGIGAIGDAVTLTSNGYIQTQGDRSSGFVAQSIGGGGGNAASNTGLFSEGLGLEKQIGGGRFTSDTGAVLEELLSEQGEEASTKGISVAVGGGTGAGGASADVIVEHAGAIDTQGADSHGIFAQSVGGGGGNGGSNSLKTGGNDGNASISIGRLGGTGGTAGNVRITSDGPIHTQGNRSHGLFAQSIGNGGGNSTTISASLSTPKNKDDNSYSVAVNVGLEGGSGGKSGNVKIDADGSLYTQGNDSHGIFAQSVGGGGGNAGGATGSVGKAASFSFNIGGKGGAGGVSGDVDVASKARIVTEGSTSIGIFAQSIGGTGGTGGFANSGVSRRNIAKNIVKGDSIGTATSLNIGGSGGDGMESRNVTVTNGNVLTTRGDGAHGIMAQSVGGGGGKGGLIENLNVSLHSTIASTITLSIGGNGGTGARSGDVSVTNTSDIGTQGKTANGIFAQAVGGGGGDAQHVRNIIGGQNTEKSVQTVLMIGGKGGSGGVGGKVDVRNETGAKIITDGNESHGIFAQSIGGGGGNGGEVLSVTVTKPVGTDNNEHELKLGIGGNGAQGGTGGMVNVINDGLIITRGDKAHGIFAQSIGGGGGNGGFAIEGSLTLKKETKTSQAIAVDIGGSGGSGNAGGNVTVTNTGEISVSGSQSYGVLAQSVGGGGGNGGMAVASSRNQVLNFVKSPSFANIAIGGAGGDGADGGNVTVNHSGTIRVSGENSYGIFAQSVGGGGGKAALSISNPAVMAADYIISTVMGARTGTKGKAGLVTVNSTGDIIVTGAGSQAIFSQSVNGGGGNVDTFINLASANNGTTNSAAGATLTSSLSLGGNDVDGNSAAAISQSHHGDIVTTSDRSAGLLMQSIGGGGGLSTTTIASSIAGDFTLNAMLGAINTDESSGGDVTAARKGNVSTFGNLSGGGLAQSIGGGGGRLIISGADRSEGSSERNAVVKLGADPSMRNNGGAVTLTLNGTVSTQGDNASGQIIQSIGAGGGEVYLAGIDHAQLTLGASDGSTGDGGNISVDNIGDLSTTGALSHGFVLQSIGGGGGLVGTNLATTSIELLLSNDNSGNGGAIDFSNQGNVVVTGMDSIGVLAQSLGGGGGSVDGLFHGSAGGNGQGGNIMLDLTGNILSLGERGIAVLAQSEGKDGADKINVGLDGVIIGGVNGQPDNRAATETAAVMIDGGTSNMLALSSKSFLMALNNRIISGSGGSDQVTLNGRAVGNIDLGGGVNSMIVSKGASFYAQNEVNLGASGQLRIDGNLYLGGVAYYTPNTSLSARMAGSEFGVTQNVSQTTALTGSLSFGNTATYTADVYFRQDTVAGGQSDLINVTGDATIAGTVIPVLHQLDRLQPLVLVNAGGVTADNGTTVVGTPVMSYEIGLNGPTGDGSSIDLIPHADFRMIGMTRNQTLTAKHAARVLSGQGTVAMGPMLALIANM